MPQQPDIPPAATPDLPSGPPVAPAADAPLPLPAEAMEGQHGFQVPGSGPIALPQGRPDGTTLAAHAPGGRLVEGLAAVFTLAAFSAFFANVRTQSYGSSRRAWNGHPADALNGHVADEAAAPAPEPFPGRWSGLDDSALSRLSELDADTVAFWTGADAVAVRRWQRARSVAEPEVIRTFTQPEPTPVARGRSAPRRAPATPWAHPTARSADEG